MIQTKHALFFDIDGTLVSFKTHEIPASTILALTQAKANGHRVFIATGRPPIIITNLGATELLIDGYVTTNGALCYVGEEIVSCQAIPTKSARLLVDDAKEKGYSLIVVGEQDLAVLDSKGDVDRIFRQQLAVENLVSLKSVEEVLQQRVLLHHFPEFFVRDEEVVLPVHFAGSGLPRGHRGGKANVIPALNGLEYHTALAGARRAGDHQKFSLITHPYIRLHSYLCSVPRASPAKGPRGSRCRCPW